MSTREHIERLLLPASGASRTDEALDQALPVVRASRSTRAAFEGEPKPIQVSTFPE
jgi:hypothetical protein